MKRAATKYSVLFVLACCLCGWACNVEKPTAAKSQESVTPAVMHDSYPGLVPTARFVMPPPNSIDPTKPIKCEAIATVALFDDPLTGTGEDGRPDGGRKLGAYVHKGTDNLNLWLEGQALLVQTVYYNVKPDRWRITGHRNKWLAAVPPRGFLPTGDAITLDERSGLAVWSLNRPYSLISGYAGGVVVYLACVNTVE